MAEKFFDTIFLIHENLTEAEWLEKIGRLETLNIGCSDFSTQKSKEALIKAIPLMKNLKRLYIYNSKLTQKFAIELFITLNKCEKIEIVSICNNPGLTVEQDGYLWNEINKIIKMESAILSRVLHAILNAKQEKEFYNFDFIETPFEKELRRMFWSLRFFSASSGILSLNVKFDIRKFITLIEDIQREFPGQKIREINLH